MQCIVNLLSFVAQLTDAATLIRTYCVDTWIPQWWRSYKLVKIEKKIIYIQTGIQRTNFNRYNRICNIFNIGHLLQKDVSCWSYRHCNHQKTINQLCKTTVSDEWCCYKFVRHYSILSFTRSKVSDFSYIDVILFAMLTDAVQFRYTCHVIN